ncbi:hypothetical protein BBW65_03400 [Helicobacter enhydrae]|uniref:Phosphatidic acid phosphatase type 2/haloperoxidase domain-containing protein n=1 Tax=Helicobacter enhydrae TaxID=222136 RepID=A0A1B1U5C7_9HELI|nr:phosphatase PAP2 family protein [Helicobacter enhydrae]ANV97902.1 hypothetical protein BBW65_03400 [Helicobacter enhydrae]
MRIVGLILACLLLQSHLNARGKFEQFGDIFKLMPLYVGVASIAIEDWKGLWQLALATGVTQLTTEGIKALDEKIARNGNESKMLWARRPGFDDFKGMPSGHSAGAFSGAAFVYYRYGWKASIAPLVLATLTAASRVYANKHSILQVSAGALIAWGYAYLFTTPYQPQICVTPEIGEDSQGGKKVALNLSYQF